MDKKVLYRFFAGKSSLQEQEQIRKWTEDSARNKETLMKERKFYDLLQIYLPERLTRPSTGKSRLFRIGKEMLKVAAVVVLTCSGYHWMQTSGEEPAVLQQTFSTPPGQRAQVTLPDGTTVWLNSRSKLTYASDFAKGGNRRVRLDGEGYFNVKKSRENRFRVETNGCDFEVLGTTFNVEAYPEQPFVRAHLLTGSLKVMTTGTIRDTLVLKPNEKVLCENNRLVKASFKNENFLLWKEGLLAFNDTQLEDILHLLEKSYGMKIKIEEGNTRLRNVTCTGKFRSNDGIDYALRVLQKSVNFTYIRDDDKGIIYLK